MNQIDFSGFDFSEAINDVRGQQVQQGVHKVKVDGFDWVKTKHDLDNDDPASALRMLFSCSDGSKFFINFNLKNKNETARKASMSELINTVSLFGVSRAEVLVSNNNINNAIGKENDVFVLVEERNGYTGYKIKNKEYVVKQKSDIPF